MRILRVPADPLVRIYIPGELGVQHEDVIFITEDGAANMTKWSGSPGEPAVV